jgi:uncharacterized protein YlaI
MREKCGQCGVRLSSENWTHRMSKPPKRWYVCDECYNKSVYKSIKKYNDKHRISTKTNCYNRLQAYRNFALNLINYTCQKCGQKSDKLELHHIDGDWKNNNASNLTILCLPCHRALLKEY